MIQGDVKYITSPVFELLSAMFRVHAHESLLLDETREISGKPVELTEWVERMRAQLPEEIKEELAVFFDWESFIGLPFIRFAWEQKIYESVDAFINYLKTTDPQTIFTQFLKTGFKREDLPDVGRIEPTIAFINESNWPEKEKWKLTYLFMNCEEAKKRFIALIENFWPYLKDDMSICLEKQSGSVAKIQGFMGEHPRANVVDFFPPLAGATPKEVDEIILAPSVFYYDCSLTSETEDSFLYVYGIKQPDFLLEVNANREKLFDAFKILSDERRVNIIRLLNQGPLYGYELANRLNLSNSTVSHHLSALSAAGLVKSVRKENRVYYEVRAEEIEKLLERMKHSLIQK